MQTTDTNFFVIECVSDIYCSHRTAAEKPRAGRLKYRRTDVIYNPFSRIAVLSSSYSIVFWFSVQFDYFRSHAIYMNWNVFNIHSSRNFCNLQENNIYYNIDLATLRWG